MTKFGEFADSWRFPLTVFAAIGALHTLPGLVGYHPIEDSKLENVQQDNNDLRTQLSQQGYHVGRLILNNDDHYSFATTGEQGEQEVCSGSYEKYDNGFFVWNDHKVKLTGNLTCSQTIELG